MKPERILVCGGRDFNDRYKLTKVMTDLVPFFADQFCIIQGGARGADSLAKWWATERGVPCIEVAANWDYFSKSAGTIRNQWMAQFCLPQIVVAFPGGSGTADMIKQAQMRGIQHYAIG